MHGTMNVKRILLFHFFSIEFVIRYFHTELQIFVDMTTCLENIFYKIFVEDFSKTHIFLQNTLYSVD